MAEHDTAHHFSVVLYSFIIINFLKYLNDTHFNMFLICYKTFYAFLFTYLIVFDVMVNRIFLLAFSLCIADIKENLILHLMVSNYLDELLVPFLP